MRRTGLGALGVDDRIILKFMLKVLVVRMLTGTVGSGLLAGYVIK